MRPVLIGLVAALTIGCASANPRPQAVEPNPCTNPTYLALRERPLNELSEREYEHLRDLERACAEYQINLEAQKTVRRMDAWRRNLVIILFGTAAVLTAIVAPTL